MRTKACENLTNYAVCPISELLQPRVAEVLRDKLVQEGFAVDIEAGEILPDGVMKNAKVHFAWDLVTVAVDERGQSYTKVVEGASDTLKKMCSRRTSRPKGPSASTATTPGISSSAALFTMSKPAASSTAASSSSNVEKKSSNSNKRAIETSDKSSKSTSTEEKKKKPGTPDSKRAKKETHKAPSVVRDGVEIDSDSDEDDDEGEEKVKRKKGDDCATDGEGEEYESSSSGPDTSPEPNTGRLIKDRAALQIVRDPISKAPSDEQRKAMALRMLPPLDPNLEKTDIEDNLHPEARTYLDFIRNTAAKASRELQFFSMPEYGFEIYMKCSDKKADVEARKKIVADFLDRHGHKQKDKHPFDGVCLPELFKKLCPVRDIDYWIHTKYGFILATTNLIARNIDKVSETSRHIITSNECHALYGFGTGKFPRKCGVKFTNRIFTAETLNFTASAPVRYVPDIMFYRPMPRKAITK